MRNPASKLQQLVRKENYALFTVAGMLANIIHLNNANISSSLISALQNNLRLMRYEIKEKQEARRVKIATGLNASRKGIKPK